MIQFLALLFLPALRHERRMRKLQAVTLLVSFASDVDLFFDWLFYLDNMNDDEVSVGLKAGLLTTNLLGVLAWMLLATEARLVRWYAWCCGIRVSTGMCLLFGILVTDLPQIILSIMVDSAKAGNAFSFKDIGTLAVLNIVTAAYDALIKMAEAWDGRDETLTTGHREIDTFVAELKANVPEVTKLDFCDKSIGNAGAIGIAEGIRVNSVLVDLNLCGNSIRNLGASSLAYALRANCSLKTLNLEANRIGPSGALEIAETLKVNRTLTTLNLCNNAIKDAGANDIATALKGNSTLTMLDLQINSIGAKGMRAMAEAVQMNCTLECLNLTGNNVLDSEKEDIRAIMALALRKNTDIRLIYVV